MVEEEGGGVVEISGRRGECCKDKLFAGVQLC